VPTLIDRNDDPVTLPGPGRNRAEDSNQARVLDPRALVAHRAVLYRVALALCRSHHEAEDLVQETFTRVLARQRLLRCGNDLPYLLRALRNTHTTGRRATARTPTMVPMASVDRVAALGVPEIVEARGVIAAIAAAPGAYRDAVVAVDLLGLSYEQAARRLRTRKTTVNTRVFRGRAHVARLLNGE
jgi:RNA polymerase sigma-70 factor (ECF subfamily)